MLSPPLKRQAIWTAVSETVPKARIAVSEISAESEGWIGSVPNECRRRGLGLLSQISIEGGRGTWGTNFLRIRRVKGARTRASAVHMKAAVSVDCATETQPQLSADGNACVVGEFLT